MKRKASGELLPQQQRARSTELMRQMKRKTARSSRKDHSKTSHSSISLTTTGTTTPRSMIQVLCELKQQQSPSLLYQCPQASLLDALEARESIYSCRHFTRLAAHERLWLVQEEAVRFIKSRELDTDGLGAHGTLYCDEMGLGKTRVVLTVVLEQNQALCLQTGRRFNGRPTLILCAPILIPNWVKEIEKFPRGSFVYRVLTEARDINRCDRFLLEQCCDIVLVTYTALRAMCNNAERYDQELLYSIVWHRLVADEAHVFVDATTETARDVFALQARCKIAMTGTPVRNKRIDLLTLVRFVGLEKLRDDIILMRTREQALERQRLVQRQCPLRSIHCLPELKSVTRRIELVQFVTVQEQVLYYLYAKLALQRKLSHRYNTPMLIGLMRQLCISPAVVKNLVLPRGLLAPALGVDTGVLLPSNVVDGSSSSSNGGENPIVRFMQNQPTAFRLRYKAGEAYNKTDPLYASSDSRISAGAVVDLIWDPFATLEAEFSLDDAETAQQYHFLYQQLTLTPGQLAVTTDMIASPVMADASEQKTMAMLSHLTRRISLLGSAPSSKECAVVKYVQSTPSDDRILIFSLYTGILDGLERALHKSGIECVVITGRTNAKVNSARLHQFQSQRRYKVLLMTLKLGNMGLNLTDCNHVLHADPWWNPWATEQGDFRIRRPGQLKPVFIIYFIMDHTMEVAIMNHTIRKKTLLQDMLSRGLATDGDNDQESQMSAEDESLLFDYEVTISSLCDTCAV